jgi:3-hydroxyisobutyrate dehydrogenase
VISYIVLLLENTLPSPTVGYVGLGSMGGALAARLQMEYPLKVFDANPAAVTRAVELGSTSCDTIAELASGCQIILLCLPTSDQVREVLLGPGGVTSTAQHGCLVIDQTSGDPHATRAMHEELRQRGITLLDAPVSGGVQGARAGTIAIMVGASPADFARAEPVLNGISSRVFHAGDVGAGHTMKLVNNLMSGAQRLLSMEAVALAAKNGLDPATVIEILLAGGGRNAYLEKIMGPQVIVGDLDFGYTLNLAHKDVRLACQLGIDSNVPMFFGNLTRELLQTCINEMGRESKVDTAALVIDRLSNTHVVPTK